MATDLSALGRLSGSPDGGRRARRVSVRRGTGPARRRPRVPRAVWVVLALVAIGTVWLGTAGRGVDPDTAPVEMPAGMDRAAEEDAARASRGGARTTAPVALARVDGLELVLPVEHAALVAFGEGGRAEALTLDPVGRFLGSEHPRFEPGADEPGPGYLVLAPQGRPRSPTSGVDVAAAPATAVLAPVSGRVVKVREYAPAGGGRDVRVVLQPDHAPSLHVELSHLQDVTVGEGDRVEAGATRLGALRPLEHSRGVDEHLDGHTAHVHLEVTPARDPEPPDPNQPAAPPEVPHG